MSETAARTYQCPWCGRQSDASATSCPACGAPVDVRVRQLAAARRRATALLAAVTVLFVAVTAAGADGTFLGYVQAGAEAAMVGGVADWFAVGVAVGVPVGAGAPAEPAVAESGVFTRTLKSTPASSWVEVSSGIAVCVM